MKTLKNQQTLFKFYSHLWEHKTFYSIRSWKNTGYVENIRTCVIWVKNIRNCVAAPFEIMQRTFSLTWRQLTLVKTCLPIKEIYECLIEQDM